MSSAAQNGGADGGHLAKEGLEVKEKRGFDEW